VIELIVECRTCGIEWTPDRADFLHGRWRTCPSCRNRDGPDHADATGADPTRYPEIDARTPQEIDREHR
jgi:hypothetical protein